jgi:hypothetical protein
MGETLKQLTLTERERSERDLRILYSSLLIGLQKVVESFPGFINPQLWLVKGKVSREFLTLINESACFRQLRVVINPGKIDSSKKFYFI